MHILARTATALAVVATGILTAAPAQAQPSGCGYGTGGEFASTICWIDMTGFDQALAMEAAGQPMTIELTPDYSMSFTFKFTPGADGYRVIEEVAFPTYGLAPIGNSAYVGTPGKPALYQQVDGGTGASGDLGTLTIEGLVVSGPSGQAVDGYGIVMADAESTNREEGLTFSSDQPIEKLTEATMEGALPACGQELSGLGTTSVTCKGDTPGGLAVDEIILYADSPSSASIGFLDRTANSVQGVAFGVLTAKVGMSKTIEDRTADGDTFGLTIEDNTGNRIGEASTGGGDSGTIESTTVLGGVEGRSYTFAETAEGDTDLSTYAQRWSCTDNGTEVPLDSGTGTTQDVPVMVGDDISCELVNTGTPPEVPTDGATAPGNGALPTTGSSPLLFGLAAAAILMAGAIGLLLARRARATW